MPVAPGLPRSPPAPSLVGLGGWGPSLLYRAIKGGWPRRPFDTAGPSPRPSGTAITLGFC